MKILYSGNETPFYHLSCLSALKLSYLAAAMGGKKERARSNTKQQSQSSDYDCHRHTGAVPLLCCLQRRRAGRTDSPGFTQSAFGRSLRDLLYEYVIIQSENCII
jgi:hypothetical protein